MFDVKRPCSNCPFRRVGGIRLNPDRVREVAGYFIEDGPGGIFPCHATVDYTKADAADEDERAATTGEYADEVWGGRWSLCAGGAIFAEKCGKMSTMMQIGTRLGLVKLDELQDKVAVFSSLREMLQVNKRDG